MKTTSNSLARFAARAGVALMLTGCGATSDAEVEVAQVSEGQALFDANCAECHGERALGDGPMAAGLPVKPPSLLEHLGHHPEAQLINIIRTGVPPAMPPAPLTDDQVRLVIEYAWELVPDSLVAGLREMQRMAEMGMEMGTGMGMEMEMDTGMHMPMDTSRR